jgi:hypothetical protein
MALKDYLELLPEEKREAFKAEAEAIEAKMAKAVVLETKDDVAKFVESNELLKQVNQADRDRRYADMLKKFEAERLPELLAAERAKGEKQPWEIEIEKLKAEREADQRALALEKQKGRALAKAAELGIPAPLVERFIGLTDEETDEGLKHLSEVVIPYRESAVKSALEKVGSQLPPQGGGSQAAITRESLQTPEGRKALLDASRQSGGHTPIVE